MGVLFNLLLLQTGVSELFANSLHYPVHLSPCSPPSAPVFPSHLLLPHAPPLLFIPPPLPPPFPPLPPPPSPVLVSRTTRPPLPHMRVELQASDLR